MENKTYRLKFIKAIEKITGKPYVEGIKLFDVLRYTEEEETECICTHDIKKVYYVSYNNKVYPIGSKCIENFSEDLTTKQKIQMREVNEKYRRTMKQVKKMLKKTFKIKGEEKSIKEIIENDEIKLLIWLRDNNDYFNDTFIFNGEEIKEKDDVKYNTLKDCVRYLKKK